MAALCKQKAEKACSINKKGENKMSNYYRITAYHKATGISAILDSNGKFDAIWKFSAYLVAKGFKIIKVHTSGNFLVGNVDLLPTTSTKIHLRAAADGEPILEPDNYFGQACTSVIVGDKLYLTDLKPE